MPSYRLKAGDRDVIRRKVARMHVSASAREVLRPFLRTARMAFNYRQSSDAASALWRKRTVRRAVYKEALRQHEKNKRLYRKVMSGSF